MTHPVKTPQLHLTVAALIEQDGRFLMVEEVVNGQTVINQPAGHVESGENLLEAVIRETREETAWLFQPLCATGVYRWILPENRDTYFRHCFHGHISDYQAEQALDEGIIQALWLSPQELRQKAPQLRSPLVMACIDDYLAGQRFPLSLYKDIV